MERRAFLRNGAASGLAAAVAPAVASGSGGGTVPVPEGGMKAVFTDQAPKPLGAYSQAIKSSGFVFVAGQTAHDPRTQQMVAKDIAVQTERVLENLKAILQAAGSSLDRTVKTTVYLADMAEFEGMNKVYARYFPSNPPARATVEVGRLHLGARVEIELIALA